jgi:hypothetical protein
MINFIDVELISNPVYDLYGTRITRILLDLHGFFMSNWKKFV